MRCVAVVQARMGSTRLPGKTLMVAAGKPMLQHLIERLQRATMVDQIVVATTVNPEDDAIQSLCQPLGVGCYRGSSEDVLSRVLRALEANGADLHVEVHGDGPLADWRVVDHAVELFRSGSYDLVTNSLTVTYPPGLEVWVYPTVLLRRIDPVARTQEYRESPALYVTDHPERFRLFNFEAPEALRSPETYLEVDTAVDFEVLRTILEALYPVNPSFTTEEILRWLEAHPGVAERNRQVERRWKRVRQHDAHGGTSKVI